jgi:hypothetical protein
VLGAGVVSCIASDVVLSGVSCRSHAARCRCAMFVTRRMVCAACAWLFRPAQCTNFVLEGFGDTVCRGLFSLGEGGGQIASSCTMGCYSEFTVDPNTPRYLTALASVCASLSVCRKVTKSNIGNAAPFVDEPSWYADQVHDSCRLAARKGMRREHTVLLRQTGVVLATLRSMKAPTIFATLQMDGSEFCNETCTH